MFGSILKRFWLHFGSILEPFWLHFGSLGEVLEKTPQRTSKIGVLGALWGSIWGPFFDKTCICFNEKMHWFFDWFVKAFWSLFGSILTSIFDKKSLLGRNRRFFENERFVYARASFWGVRGLKIRTKGLQKKIKKSMYFFIGKHIEKGSQKGTKREPTWV